MASFPPPRHSHSRGDLPVSPPPHHHHHNHHHYDYQQHDDEVMVVSINETQRRSANNYNDMPLVSLLLREVTTQPPLTPPSPPLSRNCSNINIIGNDAESATSSTVTIKRANSSNRINLNTAVLGKSEKRMTHQQQHQQQQHHQHRVLLDQTQAQTNRIDRDIINSSRVSLSSSPSERTHEPSATSLLGAAELFDASDNDRVQEQQQQQQQQQQQRSRHDLIAAHLPGAFAVPGFQQHTSSSSSTSLNDDYRQDAVARVSTGAVMTTTTTTASPPPPPPVVITATTDPILEAELVLPSSGNENDYDEHGNPNSIQARRLAQKADELAEEVLNRLRRNAVDAVMEDDDDDEDEEEDEFLKAANIQKMRRRCIFFVAAGMMLLLIVIAIVVVLVLVILPQNSSRNNDNNNNSNNHTTDVILTNETVWCDLEMNHSDQSIMKQVSLACQHTILASYINKASVTAAILTSAWSTITILAPTDASFQAQITTVPPYSYYATKQQWAGHLTFLVQSHIVTDIVNTSQIFKRQELPTLAGVSTRLAVNQANRTIENGASIEYADIPAKNGYIQVPDRVVVVSSLRTTVKDFIYSNLSRRTDYNIATFVHYMETLEINQTILLQTTDRGLTLFVPTDEAFASVDRALVTDHVMLYHISPINVYATDTSEGAITIYTLNQGWTWWTAGDPQNETSSRYVNTAQVLDTVYCSNGIVHIVHQVLLPPDTGEMLQIVTNMTSKYNFTTFLQLVRGTAQLGTLLDGNISSFYTIFAPEEGAFDKVESSLLTRLLLPTWLGHLQSLIQHHFTSQQLPSHTAGGYELTMLSGYTTQAQVTYLGTNFQYSVTIDDDASAEDIPWSTSRSVSASNGILFFVDGVLSPPWVKRSIYTQLGDNNLNFSTFLSFIDAANMTNVLSNMVDVVGPVTLLAPNNAAFANTAVLLGVEGNYHHNMSNNTAFAREFVFRHIVPGNVYLTSLGDGSNNVTTWNNQTLSVQRLKNEIYVGGALLLETGNTAAAFNGHLASNGLYHVIDRVLL